MPLKPIELPPAVARRFVEDMRAFHAEPNAIIAAFAKAWSLLGGR